MISIAFLLAAAQVSDDSPAQVAAPLTAAAGNTTTADLQSTDLITRGARSTISRRCKDGTVVVHDPVAKAYIVGKFTQRPGEQPSFWPIGDVAVGVPLKNLCPGE